MSDQWYLWWSVLSTIIGLFVTVCIISTAQIRILVRKLKITRKSKYNVTRDLEVLEREVMTRKDITSTSNKTWAHRVESINVQDQLQNPEQHDLQTHDYAQEFHTLAPIYPGVATPPLCIQLPKLYCTNYQRVHRG